jgi:hypothetical protein
MSGTPDLAKARELIELPEPPEVTLYKTHQGRIGVIVNLLPRATFIWLATDKSAFSASIELAMTQLELGQRVINAPAVEHGNWSWQREGDDVRISEDLDGESHGEYSLRVPVERLSRLLAQCATQLQVWRDS